MTIFPHTNSTPLELASFLNFPVGAERETLHLMRRELSGHRPILSLTEIGRQILCAHIAGAFPQTCLTPDLIEALSINSKVNPPTNLNSWGFHFMNLMWNLRGMALRRSDLNSFKTAIASSFANHPHPDWFAKRSEDDDAIQHVNKTSQWGLQHKSEILRSPTGESIHYYYLSTPFDFTNPSALRKPGAKQSFETQIPPCNCEVQVDQVPVADHRDLVKERLRVLEYLTDSFLNVPVSGWTLEGHKDAQNKDRGTVAQPKKFNRSARDRWKFDDYGLTRCPSIGNLTENLRDFYPSNEELLELLHALQEELGISPISEKSDS